MFFFVLGTRVKQHGERIEWKFEGRRFNLIGSSAKQWSLLPDWFVFFCCQRSLVADWLYPVAVDVIPHGNESKTQTLLKGEQRMESNWLVLLPISSVIFGVTFSFISFHRITTASGLFAKHKPVLSRSLPFRS